MKSPQVFGKYLLLERISVGGMAEIFIAKAFGVEGFERMLAIKKILPSMAEDLEFITMFIDEARISSQLNHANVVHIHELGKYDDAYYIAMEHVQGLDLRAIAELYRRERQAMPVPMAAYIISRVCEGLDYAHRAKDGRGQDLNIVHRDVSPQNVLVSFDGEVKIIDFGIAKAANRTQQTQVGILKGKFGYMSPEQALGKPIDRRSDLFAVGVILYELLTGDRLFVGESDFSVVEKVRTADIISPREMNPEIPKALEKVILKALARDQHDRYQWCSELQEDLNRFLISEGTIYSGKQLSHFMHEAFADDLQREAERMERFASVERPDDLEDSNVAVSPRRRSSRQIPVVTAPAPRLTPSRGTPAGGAPARKPSDPAVPRARPPSVELARKPSPAEEELEAPPAPERTQIVDASHLRDKPAPRADTQARAVAEQPTNVKTQHPPKGKVVIGDKAVHGPTVIGAAPESRSKPATRRNPPPIDAPPSVVVDAGLGLDQAYDSAPDTGVHDLPQDTGAFAQPPEFAEDEPRTQGVESYSFGEEPPETTPVAKAPQEEDEAPPPWPSMEGKGETVIGPAPTAPPEKKRVSSLAEESNRRRAALAAEQPSVIVGSARLEDADEATPTPSDVGLSDPEQTSPLQSAELERAAAAPSLAEAGRAPTATSELDALAPVGSVALGDTEAPPSTGSATRLENPAPSNTADELDALMGGAALGDAQVAETGEVDRLEAPESLAPPDEQDAPTSGPMEFQADEAVLGGAVQERTGEVPAISQEEGDEEEDGTAERTAAIESPLWSSAPDAGSEPQGYQGQDRTAATPAPSELLDTHPEEDDGEDRTAAIAAPSLAEEEDGEDRTAAIAAPSLDREEEEEGYGGHDRTAATRAPSELEEEDGEGTHGDGPDRRGDTGVSEAPEGLQDEEEEDRQEQTRPERSPRRAPAAPMSQRTKLIALGGAAAALVLVVVGLVLSLGGEPAGALMVLAEPSSARITVDGREIKSGVVLTGLEAGEHELVVSAPGFKTHRAKLKTTDAQNTTQVALVSEASAVAEAEAEPQVEAPPPQGEQAADPQAAEEKAPVAAGEKAPVQEPVAVEEKADVQAPTAEEKPEPVAETRVASATKPAVQEAPASEIRQTRTPRRRTGRLAITSSPMGAEIFVNGKSTGRKTPVAFGSALTLPAGSNMLVLKSGKLKFVKEIMIEADEMNTVRNAVLE